MTIKFSGFKRQNTRILNLPEREGVVGNLQSFQLDPEGNTVPIRSIRDATQFGYQATSGGNQAVSLGGYSTATGDFSVAVGYRTRALGTSSVAVGNQASALAAQTVAIGERANATKIRSIAIGILSEAAASSTIAIGKSATASSENDVSIGTSASSGGSNAVAIGGSATTASGVAIGGNSNGNAGIAIGPNASATSAVAIGKDSTATQGGTAIGSSSTADGDSTVAVGANADAGGDRTVVVGQGATASGDYSISFGNLVTVNHNSCLTVLTGSGASTANNQALIGTGNSNNFYNDFDLGMGQNQQRFQLRVLTELTTIAAAATTNTSIQIPADAVVFGVSARVTVLPTGTGGSTFDVGVAGATTRYGSGISTAAGTTHDGTDDATRYYSAATAIRITQATVPSDTAGRIRITIHYYEIQPPTS